MSKLQKHLEIELEWLLNVYSPKFLNEAENMIKVILILILKLEFI